MRRTLPLDRLPRDWLGDRGLDSAEADERRRAFGDNRILETPPGGWRDLARDTVRDPMLWFLAGTSALYLAVGQRLEGATLAAALLPLVAMDLYLHRRTQASTAGLQSRLAASARVVRDGQTRAMPAVLLVPGDLVVVAPGEPFPADGIVVAGEGLQADESTLTGEAYPVAKRAPEAVARDAGEPALDHAHWGFAGTRLLTGPARLRVVFTGGETLYGEIVRSAVRGSRAPTPLQTAIRGLVSTLVAAAGVMCVIMAWARLRQGFGWIDALVSAVTLASAALPEEFPVVFTFFLGVGVYRLARRQALVRRAVSVENIGRVTCVAADKTGTITQGRLHLTHLVPADAVDDAGLLHWAATASREDSGDPLDAAIVHAAAAAGAAPARGEILAQFPFTEARRRESAIVRTREGALVAAVKGAAEVVIAMCTLTEAERAAWLARAAELAAGAHKVIGCAWRPIDPARWAGDELERGYRLAGLLALEDPVREGVSGAVARCREAGIHTIMVTGDHPLTAEAVAREIGLGGAAPHVVSADALEVRGGREVAWRTVDVLARAAPAQKLALVRALQGQGEIVAVTGDGVNDVPALQAADVGIAMGERATRSAREVAAIVLLDDNFRTIVRAIGEGRQLFANLQRAFAYLLMVHVPLVITAALLPLAGYPLLYLPTHIVWVELVIHPTALLVFQELPAGDRLAPAAAGPRRFFSRRQWTVIALAGAWLTAAIVWGYLGSVAERGDIEHGRATALATLTLASAALTAALSGLRGRAARWIAPGTALLTVVLVQAPVPARLLHLAPLHAGDWALALGSALGAGLLALGLAPGGRQPA